MRSTLRIIAVLSCTLVGLAAQVGEPLVAIAATTPALEVSGWIPYWRKDQGVAEVMAHLDQLKEINPFGYSVAQDGTLNDLMAIADEPWVSLKAAAKARKIRFVPTVMWSDSAAIHRILSNQKSRIKLEDDITALVRREGFDGIDIDFEGKRAEDRDYFSTFLKGLYQRMGTKWVMCTIESRIATSDRYWGVEPPPGATNYANDFLQINKYCDRVRFMTYDQQTIDMRLGSAADTLGEVYGPVADSAWVEKAAREALRAIPRQKIVIGVATYGYEWAITAYADGYTYDLLWSFNPNYATGIAGVLGITPSRSLSGEMAFSYVPTSTALAAQYPTPAATFMSYAVAGVPQSKLVSSGALQLAKSNNSTQSFRYMVWQDPQSIKEKVDIVKRLGLRGVAVFKFDGGAVQGLWDVLK